MNRDYGVRRWILPNLSAVLKGLSRPRWTTPLLVALGILSSLAEAAGVSVALLFVYLMLDRVDLLTLAGGTFGSIFRFTAAHLHSSTSLVACLVLLVMLRSSTQYGYAMLSASVGESMSQTLQNRVHRHYLRVSYRIFQRHHQGDLINTLGREAWFVADAYIALVRAYVNVVSIVMLGSCLVILSPRMAALIGMTTCFVYLFINALSAKSKKVGVELRVVWQRLWDHMMVSLEGMRAIRAFGQELVVEERFDQITAEARRAGVESKRVTALLEPLGDIGLLLILSVIVVGARWLHVDFPIVLALVALLGRIEPHVRDLEKNRLFLSEKEPQFESLRALLEAGDRGFIRDGVKKISFIQSFIRFDGVTFSYSDQSRPALQDVSFSIPVGGTTALVGASGSGKSTIVNLLLKLYNPSAGSVSIDGTSLQELSRAEWLKLIALAGQDVDLVEGTIKTNIKVADIHASDLDIAAALEAIGATEIVGSLPGGAECWIGPHATRLSGGQRQRIGLARAVLHDPQLLILDEAMSAMDLALEGEMRGLLSTRFCGRTILLITHRLETVLSADHVICLEEGRVIAEGKPQEMLRDTESMLSKAMAARG